MGWWSRAPITIADAALRKERDELKIERDAVLAHAGELLLKLNISDALIKNLKEQVAKRTRKPKTKFRMCVSKKNYTSEQADGAAIQHGQRKYECPVCGNWHLTTKEKQ